MTLIFIYNADTGFFNTLTDMAHKVMSPKTYACSLCAITHGPLKMRDAWRTFLNNLNCEVKFLHRDEFKKQFADRTDALPTILLQADDGSCQVVAKAPQINACGSLDELKKLIEPFLDRRAS